MSFKDLVLFYAERIQAYFETPKKERNALKRMKRERWSTKWFGMIPFSFKMFILRQKSRFKRH